ncbi:type II toxin-antitoxin system BrnA family antitoxin [Blastomonas sp. SL216]|uniref:type II toxin-antitoxin system BrnA family antitoxin n=1 Tax=Blastomonas sp. SL216 TaxID=2995169 RepID=UPI0023777CE2|nr:CopG family antitoxin [Blastomonas sp. SL216]
MKPKTISAEEFDRMFDDGEDISEYLDWSTARRLHEPAKRVNVDFPADVVSKLDRAAKRRGVSRQALIKMWIVAQLDNEALVNRSSSRSEAVGAAQQSENEPKLDNAA